MKTTLLKLSTGGKKNKMPACWTVEVPIVVCAALMMNPRGSAR